MYISATVRTVIHAPLETVFDFVAAEDVLPKILHSYGPIPAVIGTTLHQGPWTVSGAYRTVHLAGGGHLREELDEYQRPHLFTYTISQFSFAVKYLAAHGKGEFRFSPQEEGTVVTWTYRFKALSWLAVPFIGLLMTLFYKTFMQRAMDRSRRLIESS